MPLYEYECARCGKRFELIQKFNDPPEAACPSCGSPASRLLSAPAIQFKGSGWYVTDYARKSAPAEQSESKAGGETATGKAEAKKAEKKESPAPAKKDSD